MKGFKGFEPGLICRGKQYKENEVFEEESAVICESGMHFCKNPLDVLNYYDLFNSKGQMNEFATVEALDEVHTYDDKKFCTKKLRIGAKLSLSEFIKASIDVTQTTIREEVDKARLKAKKGGNSAKLAGGYSAKLAGGNYAKLAGGNSATLAGGYSAKLAGGDYATLAGGNYATLAGGNYAKLAGGNYATLAGGNYATLAGGDYATLAGGDSATLAGGNSAKLAGGDSATLAGGNYAKLAGGYSAKLAGGENAVMVGGHGSIAKGKKGSVIVLVATDNYGNIVNFKAEQVDGERIKEDTFYMLVDGEFQEVKG